MKVLYRTGADAIFILHFLLVLLVVFGFLLPSFWYLYMAALVATLISDLVFGYCILSKWEFDLRKKINPKINYNFTWTTYYTYKITNYKISDNFYRRASIVVLVGCIALNLYFKFLF
ncbi:MAG: DUF2784 family protein [Candidatus Pacebacteria bacterium]|nr:DUF2784 family protein [Candidatus Paceibacterota bacterium]